MNKSIPKSAGPVFILTLLVLSLGFLLLPLLEPVEMPLFFLWLGRFHPLIVHFPIVLILLASLLEAGKYFNLMMIGDKLLKFILIGAVLSTLASIGIGFFLYASGDYAGNLMNWHLKAGSVLGTLMLMTLAFYFLNLRNKRYFPFYVTGLLLCNVLMIVTAHQGGMMTHGKEFLSEYIPAMLDRSEAGQIKPENEMLVYEDMIAPILEAKCVSCHNTQRKKGGLSLSNYSDLFTRGESNHPSIITGKPDSSESYLRVNLPLTHKDHMPPDGKTPMTADEIDLLKHWIGSGAQEQVKITQASEDTTMRSAIQKLLPELVKYQRRAEVARVKSKSLDVAMDELAQRLKVNIERDSMNDGHFYSLSMKFPPAPFTNDQFRELSPYFDAFSRLSLVASGIDDDGLYYVGQMSNLRELYIQKTNVTGSGLVYLQQLSQLEILNLSFTPLDDKIALDLLKLPALKEVYLYRTRTTRQVIEAMRKNKPQLKIRLEEGPFF